MKQNMYELIGRSQLDELVNVFYSRVSKHPKLKPIFPADLDETARKQKQFLTQFLGGPPLYSEEHGHPMLRARHLPFEITPERASAWLSCMEEAMDEVELDIHLKEHLLNRLTFTAHHMVNTGNPEEKGESN
ncbi:globin [Guptibacillus algicola]|uniref:globin domain-containing protein n=1 Tax=Guptibacillus algicola TaxID=225844 RepID=UPI001CD339B2|nr:globin [Alkalihalobacillus algicola]MCA0987828.1 globin [Alkalihalobacillus algicola]